MSTMSGDQSTLSSFIAMFAAMAVAFLVALMLLGSGTGRNMTLPRLVPTIASGLKPEHHGELNRVFDISATRYDELRREYEGNPVAQQQIDVYDPATEYHDKLREYIEATKSGSREKIVELEKWFKEHYPDVCRMQIVRQSSTTAIEWLRPDQVSVPRGLLVSTHAAKHDGDTKKIYQMLLEGKCAAAAKFCGGSEIERLYACTDPVTGLIGIVLQFGDEIRTGYFLRNSNNLGNRISREKWEACQ